MAEPLFSSRSIKPGNSIASDPNCSACRLDRKCKSPKMGVTGEGKQGILFIAEAPGKREDIEGEQLIGDAGIYLRGELRKMGLLLDLDCWKINAVNCRPDGNRTPTDTEITYCRPMIMATIEELKPQKIIILGSVALASIIGHRWPGQLGTITNRWRSRMIPDRELKTWLYPTFHPSYIIRSGKDELLANSFSRDLRNAIEHDIPRIDWTIDPEKEIEILVDAEKIRRAIRQIRDNEKLTSFDYETTGLKPYTEGHDIVTASMANGRRCISFPMYPEIRKPWIRFLKSGIPKTGHNIKFEELWSEVILETRVTNWRLCTMQAAHVLDNRKNSSLEFMGYVLDGWLPWGGNMERYKKGKGSNGANRINLIRKAPMRSLLQYGGMDSFVQNRVAHKMVEMGL